MYVPYPRVTQVIKEMLPNDGLMHWKRKVGAKEAKRIANEASAVGTLVHYRILNSLVKYEIPLPRFNFKDCPINIKTLCEIAEVEWAELLKKNFKIERGRLEVEKFTVEHDLKVCGTYDLAGNFAVNGNPAKWSVADLKTSPVARESHFIQLGAYALFMDPYPEQGVIISVCPYPEKNPTLEARLYVLSKKELQERSRQFKKLLKGYHKKHPNLKRFKYSK